MSSLAGGRRKPHLASYDSARTSVQGEAPRAISPVLGGQDQPDGDFGTTRVVALDGTDLSSEPAIQLGSEAGTSDLELEWADGPLVAAWEDRRHGEGTVYVRLLDLP